MKGTRVQSLLWEDAICLGATKPSLPCTTTSGPLRSQVHATAREAPILCTQRKPVCSSEDPEWPKKSNNFEIILKMYFIDLSQIHNVVLISTLQHSDSVTHLLSDGKSWKVCPPVGRCSCLSFAVCLLRLCW